MNRTLFQAATLQSLMLGNYYGFISYDELLTHGDFGIGTFEGLDGEMITLDGVVYRADADGYITTPATSTLSPYCVMAPFTADATFRLDAFGTLAELCAALDGLISPEGKNYIYAARISGCFANAALRSVEGSLPPYAITGTAAISRQHRFTLRSVAGTAVAMRFPDYMDRVNMPGWHLHFITNDRSRGGHVTDLAAAGATVELCALDTFEMMLPEKNIFGGLPLMNVSNDAVKSAEE